MSYTSFSITKLHCAKIKHSDWLKEVECEFEHSVKKIYFSIVIVCKDLFMTSAPCFLQKAF